MIAETLRAEGSVTSLFSRILFSLFFSQMLYPTHVQPGSSAIAFMVSANCYLCGSLHVDLHAHAHYKQGQN